MAPIDSSSSSMLLCGDRSDISYIAYTYRIGPIAAGCLIYHPGPLRGPPNGSQAAPADAVRNLLYIFTKIGKKYLGGPF